MLLARLAGQLALVCRAFSFSSSSSASGGVAAQWARRKLRDYRFVELKREDCTHSYIRFFVLKFSFSDFFQNKTFFFFFSGWGPGGQKMNSAQNAVQLCHKPTGKFEKLLWG